MIERDLKTLSDREMVDVLHNLVRTYEQNVEFADLGKVLRDVANRLDELTKTAATRRHWTGHE